MATTEKEALDELLLTIDEMVSKRHMRGIPRRQVDSADGNNPTEVVYPEFVPLRSDIPMGPLSSLSRNDLVAHLIK